MTAPVRLRGSVGERRVDDRPLHRPELRLVEDRRRDAFAEARVDECIAIAKAPLLRVIEEQAAELRNANCAADLLRGENAVLRAENKQLTLQLNQHMDEVVHLTGALAHRDKEIERLQGERPCSTCGQDAVTVASALDADGVRDEWTHCNSCGEDYYTGTQASNHFLRVRNARRLAKLAAGAGAGEVAGE